MEMRLTWDEAKRRSNLAKHGLDFADAGEVLDSHYRLDIGVVVHTERDGSARIISFRRASREEREVYCEWLEDE